MANNIGKRVKGSTGSNDATKLTENKIGKRIENNRDEVGEVREDDEVAQAPEARRHRVSHTALSGSRRGSGRRMSNMERVLLPNWKT
jgi:hypothetical protein